MRRQSSSREPRAGGHAALGSLHPVQLDAPARPAGRGARCRGRTLPRSSHERRSMVRARSHARAPARPPGRSLRREHDAPRFKLGEVREGGRRRRGAPRFRGRHVRSPLSRFDEAPRHRENPRANRARMPPFGLGCTLIWWAGRAPGGRGRSQGGRRIADCAAAVRLCKLLARARAPADDGRGSSFSPRARRTVSPRRRLSAASSRHQGGAKTRSRGV